MKMSLSEEWRVLSKYESAEEWHDIPELSSTSGWAMIFFGVFILFKNLSVVTDPSVG